jgi:hypothetical protein
MLANCERRTVRIIPARQQKAKGLTSLFTEQVKLLKFSNSVHWNFEWSLTNEFEFHQEKISKNSKIPITGSRFQEYFLLILSQLIFFRQWLHFTKLRWAQFFHFFFMTLYRQTRELPSPCRFFFSKNEKKIVFSWFGGKEKSSFPGFFFWFQGMRSRHRTLKTSKKSVPSNLRGFPIKPKMSKDRSPENFPNLLHLFLPRKKRPISKPGSQKWFGPVCAFHQLKPKVRNWSKRHDD